ncbi:HlyD family secretion protein [Pseudomonas aeruginosa]|nr:HlyD family secretion protein [Pseudomonas aeruginosa]
MADRYRQRPAGRGPGRSGCHAQAGERPRSPRRPGPWRPATHAGATRPGPPGPLLLRTPRPLRRPGRPPPTARRRLCHAGQRAAGGGATAAGLRGRQFPETQLTHVSPGQAVEIRVDTFPGEVLRGHVDSIAPATGLSFAPIAPDNATGNFTKVVQRIPVKIVLEPRQAMAGKLRVGMSVEARIDTATGTRSAEVAQQ